MMPKYFFSTHFGIDFIILISRLLQRFKMHPFYVCCLNTESKINHFKLFYLKSMSYCIVISTHTNWRFSVLFVLCANFQNVEIVQQHSIYRASYCTFGRIEKLTVCSLQWCNKTVFQNICKCYNSKMNSY